MKELRYTGQYKKDLKRFLNQPKKLEELNGILTLLANEQPIPPENNPHKLTGDYAGYNIWNVISREIFFLFGSIRKPELLI